MKVNVIFHSQRGNTYLLAKSFYNAFLNNNMDVDLYALKDPFIEKLKTRNLLVAEYCEEINEIKTPTVEDLAESDILVLGCPTYFGNVSGTMKMFLDSSIRFWEKSSLCGKPLISFSSAGTPEGGAHLCLNAINTWGFHMGMIPISVPANLMEGVDLPAYGIVHYSGPKANLRPEEILTQAIDKYVNYVVKCIQPLQTIFN